MRGLTRCVAGLVWTALLCSAQVIITEFPIPTPASAPVGITAGPDGNLWFTETSVDAIGRITPAGVVMEFSVGITPGSMPYEITAGPDGNLWFTESNANQIGRITPAGVVKEFPLPTGTTPIGITAGPDGNLWFAEESGAIGRITTAGVVTAEFSAGITPGSEPYGITAGPDGNLWFTELNAFNIGRITTTGTVTEFPYGSIGSDTAVSIAAGPDGNLWFTEFLGDKIGQITPTGTVIEFTAGISPGSFPYGITAGPDGNLWFAEFGGSRIAQITLAGAIKEFSAGISPGSSPADITTGPDGNLWFTENTGNRIGRATLSSDAYQISYAANLNKGDSFVNLTSAGTESGSDQSHICADVYVFAHDQQLIACCSCPLTPNHLSVLSTQNDLISKPLTPGTPTDVTIALVGSTNCDASAINSANLTGGLRAWRTTLHALPSGGFGVTENAFSRVAASSSELSKLAAFCGFIQANGSGFGICNACRPGAQGATRE
jgi:streptogramin lyase